MTNLPSHCKLSSNLLSPLFRDLTTGTIGRALRRGDALGAALEVVLHLTKENVRTDAPGAGIGIADGSGRAAGTRGGLAHVTGSARGTCSEVWKNACYPILILILCSCLLCCCS